MNKVDSVLDSEAFLLLQDISNVLTSSLNLQESVSSIFETLNARFGFMKAMLTIVDSGLKRVKIKVSFGIDPAELESVFLKKWEQLTQKVLMSRQAVVIAHIEQDGTFVGEQDQGQLTEESFICLPLVLGEEMFGTLAVDLPYFDDVSLDNITKLLGVVSLMIAQELRLKRLLDNEKDVLREENVHLKRELADKFNIHNMIGKSGAMQDVYRSIHQVAPSNANVLIRGESGTGKELVAHAVHYLSQRAQKPFIRINCGAIPETLIESELFGHEQGAFTDAVSQKKGKFEAANGGTIFLDEVAELTPQLQVKLLRVIQEKEITRIGSIQSIKVDVRVIAATNKNLEEAIQKGEIREDFYYRLNVFPILMPALKQRNTDVLLLAEYFLEKYAKENCKKISVISDSVVYFLLNYSWPGNVRELENSIERAVIMCDSTCLEIAHFPSFMRTNYSFESKDGSLKYKVDHYERSLIIDMLQKTQGNVSRAARELETTNRILGYKIKSLNINLKQI